MAPQGITKYQWFRFNLYFVIEHFLGYNTFQKILKGKKEALNREIEAQLTGSNRGELLQHPIITHKFSQDELFKIVKNSKVPVVFKNAAKDWESCKTWSFDFFKQEYGETEILLNDNVGLVDRNNPQAYETMKFGDYIDELKQGSQKYLKFSRFMDKGSPLRDDVNIDWLRKFHLPGSGGEQFLMFMGNTESMTPIHAGFAHTVFIQVTGRKKWVMWAPNERIFFDPRAERRMYNFTHADPYDMGDSKYPLFKFAKQYEIILEPGDVLWFSSHLWHQVENLEGGVSVAYKFIHLPTSFKSSFVMTTLMFLATRPSLFKDALYHRLKKTDYIFTRSQKDIKEG